MVKSIFSAIMTSDLMSTILTHIKNIEKKDIESQNIERNISKANYSMQSNLRQNIKKTKYRKYNNI